MSNALEFIVVSAGKGFVEAVKNKTEEELDEEVRMESEDVKVNHSTVIINKSEQLVYINITMYM